MLWSLKYCFRKPLNHEDFETSQYTHSAYITIPLVLSTKVNEEDSHDQFMYI